MSDMCAVYKVSSSVKVKQLEAELWSHLSALKAEIEENRGTGSSNAYRKDEAPGKDCGEIAHERQQADGLPLHTVHLEQFMPELESLLAYFCLPYDSGNLKTTADEMELFSMVWREFKTIFRQQEQMKTFPPYDGMDDRESQWGRKSANMAVCKEANWIPFIQVKPRRDPWQQKLFTKLKEKNSVDELLQMQCKFLQVEGQWYIADY
ncbi:putative uncharacterized protein C6orf183 [Pundamilia nyererei]|uniref:Uncharacterized protein n=1 Tax=Pundamilia nyererei TaxID=303518 RepID=A0A9Y3RE71_9CICH|nr:PREDICTED: putative uncharacterized protein C6orf183 [Pundamilia nyererei]